MVRKLAAFGSAAALALSGVAISGCDAPAPQCDFYVHWTSSLHVANYTAACIGGVPTWGVPGFATGFQVAFTSQDPLLTANWKDWSTPRWYNPGTAVYFTQDDYLQCMPYQTLWYRPILGTMILNGIPQHVTSYGSPLKVTCGNGVFPAGAKQAATKPMKVATIKLTR